MVHPGRSRARAAGADRLRPDPHPRLLQRLLPVRHAARDRARRQARRTPAAGHGPAPLREFGLRGQRHGGEVGLVLLEPAGQAEQEAVHQPQPRLPRRRPGLGQPHRHEVHARAVRPAAAALPPYRQPLPLGRRLGEGPRRVRARGRGLARGQDPRARCRERGGLRRRADPGCWRRDHPARHLLAGDPADLPRARRAARGRRGHLRLRPHRQLVGPPDHGLHPRSRLDGQGPVLGLRADRRRRLRQARGRRDLLRREGVRARRDLCRSPGLRCRGPGEHRDHRGGGPGHPCRRSDRRLFPRRAVDPGRRPAGGRGAHPRPDRLRRAGRRQGRPPPVRARRQGRPDLPRLVRRRTGW